MSGPPLTGPDPWPAADQRSAGGHVASVMATMLERLDAAGAVDLGRLNMSDLALEPTRLNALYGRARNLWNVNIVTGGSLSSSGVTIAAGRRGRPDGVHASLFVSRPACACAADRLFRQGPADRAAACRAAFRREPAARDWRRLPTASAAPA